MKKNNSFISSFIGIIILFAIISYFRDTIIMILAIGFVCLLIFAVLKLLISRSTKSSYRQNSFSSENEYTSTANYSEQIQKETIKRQVEILSESIQLVNNSNNLNTVLKRYLTVYNAINKLLPYTDFELRTAGYSFKEPLSETRNYILNNRITIINQAIERNLQHELSLLKTDKGKVHKLDTLYKEMKNNENLEKENLTFLDNLYKKTRENLTPSPSTTVVATEALQETLKAQASDNKKVQSPCQLMNISPEISDLIWIGDGIYKNYTYTPPARTSVSSNAVSVTFATSHPEEPSVLYLDLPFSEPPDDTVVERPPYSPNYKDLLPEQKWLYWKFLSNPFSQGHDVGYAFLFYYGLERHLLSGKLNKAFDVVLKLREIYDNNSFQFYSGTALTLTCIAKQRADLAEKLLYTYSQNRITFIRTDYLLLLKYTFQTPLTTTEIIRNYQYFGFDNNRYIKNQPEMFAKALTELIRRDFHEDTINLNQHFPLDISSLPVKQERMYANVSLNDYEMPFPSFENPEMNKKISSLLTEAHETVKFQLKKLRKQGTNTRSNKQSASPPKLSPIEMEDIPQKINVDFSELEGCETWDNEHLIEMFYELSRKIQTGKEILPKIEACEKSYKILKPVIKFFKQDPDGLPPIINCREYGPSLYNRLGNWEDAERAIKICIDAEAYDDPDDGNAELDYLSIYKKVGQAAINFIQNNPGYLQKNIYVALSKDIGEENIPILKNFMRDSYVFHKQPYKGSNKLYYIERKP